MTNLSTKVIQKKKMKLDESELIRNPPLPCRDNAEREEEVQRQEIRFNIAEFRNLKGKVHTHRQAYQVHI